MALEQIEIDEFRGELLAAGIRDKQGIHHEFVSGMHGQKLDFDRISTGDDLYNRWIGINAAFIEGEFPDVPEIIVGVANGTNRVALDTALRLGVLGLESEKNPDNSKILSLPEAAKDKIKVIAPELVVIVEDVGTTGSNSVQVATAVRDEAGVSNVEVVTTWKRRENLERLLEAGIPYRAIIDEPLVTYSPEDCEGKGFCSLGWEFIPHGQ